MSHQLSPLMTKPTSKSGQGMGIYIYISAGSFLSMAPSAVLPQGPATTLLSPYPCHLLYESSPLPFTCPHTFYFPATGSWLDKKTCHWWPSLSEQRVVATRQLMFLWKEHHNFPIHLKCYQCAWGRPHCRVGAEIGAGGGTHSTLFGRCSSLNLT